MDVLRQLIATPVLGLPAFAWGGVTILLLIVIQVLIGAKVLKVNFMIHRVNGFVILSFAILHATAALIYLLG